MNRKTCPECGTSQRSERMDCGCGYTWPEKPHHGNPGDPDRHRCEWTSDGNRCRNPGSCSHSTTGGGPWYCREHSTCKDGVIGRQIVERSGLKKVQV